MVLVPLASVDVILLSQPPKIEFTGEVPEIQLVCPLIIVLLTPVEDSVLLVPPIITDAGEVVDSPLPMTTELHAPVPPTEEEPKTMVLVAPANKVALFPIATAQFTPDAAVPPTPVETKELVCSMVIGDPPPGAAAPVGPTGPVAPFIPEVPLVPSVPLVPEVPETPLVPDVPSAPLVPDVPELPDTPEVPEVPDDPAAPVGPIGPPVTAPVKLNVVVESSNGRTFPNPSVTGCSVLSAPEAPMLSRAPYVSLI